MALGVAALLAGVAGLSSVVTSGSRCAGCGSAMGGQGSRSLVNEDELAAAEDPRLARRREQTQYINAGFYLQRMDAPNWWVAPVALIEKLNGHKESRRIAFMREQWRIALQAMGGRKVEWKSKAQKPQVVTGRLSINAKRFRELMAYQVDQLRRMGAYPLSMGVRGELVHDPVRTVKDYLEERQASINKLPDNTYASPWQRKYPKAYYAAFLYIGRAWALHVMAATGATSRGQRATLSGPSKGSGILGDLTLRLVLPKAVPEVRPGAAYDVGVGPTMPTGGQASVAMFRGNEQVGIYNLSDVGTLGGFSTGRTQVGLLAKTSKMSAPSLSLPAGNPKAGGTCVMAGVEVQAAHRDENMICNSCYATKANYGYPESMVSTHVRLAWVEDALRAGTFTDGMTAAISCYARYTTEGGYSKDAKSGGFAEKARPTQELGIWDAQAGRIRMPPNRRKVERYAVVTRITSYAALGVKARTSVDLFKQAQTPNGAVCGFFRIHDAGDFSVRGSPRYVQAWGQVARRFPHVFFWAPTRAWARKVRYARLTGPEVRWISAGLKNGMRIEPTGSLSRLERIGGRLAQRVQRRVATMLRPELRGLTVEDLLETHGEEVGLGSSVSPGETESVLLSGAGDQTPASFAYVPNEPMMKAFRRAARGISNFAIRPSSLYVKTPENPAFVPKISGIADGSGVNTYWGSLTAWQGALIEAGVYVADATDAQRARMRQVAKDWAAEVGHDPAEYVPVFDNDGAQAYQCPVYSALPVLDQHDRPVLDQDGQPKLAEAKSCQAAGCRACWISPETPITYGFH